jgi:hypothetical protein
VIAIPEVMSAHHTRVRILAMIQCLISHVGVAKCESVPCRGLAFAAACSRPQTSSVSVLEVVVDKRFRDQFDLLFLFIILVVCHRSRGPRAACSGRLFACLPLAVGGSLQEPPLSAIFKSPVVREGTTHVLTARVGQQQLAPVFPGVRFACAGQPDQIVTL